MVLDASLLNIQHYKVWIKGKWSNPRKEVGPFPTPWYGSYWKGTLWVALNYGWPTYIHIYKESVLEIILQLLSFLVSISFIELWIYTWISIQDSMEDPQPLMFSMILYVLALVSLQRLNTISDCLRDTSFWYCHLTMEKIILPYW